MNWQSQYIPKVSASSGPMKRIFSCLTLAVSLFVLFIFTFLPGADASDYKVVTVRNGGSIKGRIAYKGIPPEPEKIRITRDLEFCGNGKRVITWVRVNKGGLAETIVYLDKVAEGKDWPASQGRVEHLDLPDGKAEGLVTDDGTYVIDQKDCRFLPWIRVYRKGADLVVKNSDPILHNIDMREMLSNVKKIMFNITQRGTPDKPAKNLHKKISPRRSPFLTINCDAHNFMFSWGFAAENPYAVVVNRDGTYEISDIPAGTYRLRTWHPLLGIQDAEVKVVGNGSVAQDFIYEAEKTYKLK